jgi:hypothetical protein
MRRAQEDSHAGIILAAMRAILLAAVLATPLASSGDFSAHTAGKPPLDEPQVEIAKDGKPSHVARIAYEAGAATRAEVGFRLVGRTITGTREVVRTRSVVRDAEPGRVRLEIPFREARRSCFPYKRCSLKVTAKVTELADPVPPATEPTPAGELGTGSAATGVRTGEPRIRERHIGYGPKRRRQMAAYSERHYGEREWRLEPHGIVEHYTASSTAGPALNTFEANWPDVEYGELPGVCAHYLIDTDGTIMELVPTGIRCRHTVGLNHRTIGIEHVGNSDSDVVGRPRVLRASLALTGWLRCAYAIERSNVIGHNESLGSPLYEEHVPSFQGRTHGDMKPATMRAYRRKLGGC